MGNSESYLLFFTDKEFYIPLKIKNHNGTLCVWRMQLSYQDVLRLVNFVFKKFQSIDKVSVMRVSADDGTYPTQYLSNDFVIELPDHCEEIDFRLSKKGRYNIKRERRIAETDFGSCHFIHCALGGSDSIPLTEKFFEWKKKTIGSDYAMSAEEYLKSWFVSDIYYLAFGKRIASIIMSCEQCECVYLENITYDPELSSYSPGQIAYDYYLKELIRKGKKKVFLSGGDYEYKRRYGSQESTIADFEVVRKSLKSYMRVYGKKLLIGTFHMLPSTIRSRLLKRRT